MKGVRRVGPVVRFQFFGASYGTVRRQYRPQGPLMSNASDALLAKTDAELRFFVENPQFYQPELVGAARRELQRRAAANPRPATPAASAAPASEFAPPLGAAPVPATPAPFAPPPPLDFAATELDEPTRRRPWLLPVLGLLAVGVGLGVYRWSEAAERTSQAEAARAAAKLSPAALKLDAVATTSTPTYNIAALVDKQAATIPAAEKQDAQALRQFREMARRFWAAETEAEYLTKLAHDGKAGSAFANQARLNRENWREWNRGAAYGFKFGPTMQRQYKLMGDVASSQQHIMDLLPNKLADQAYLGDKELSARGGDVQAWMADLQRVSPVTGQPYQVATIEASQLGR